MQPTVSDVHVNTVMGNDQDSHAEDILEMLRDIMAEQGLSDAEIEAALRESGLLKYDNLSDLQKPYPTEHAARQADPGNFTLFRRKNDAFGPGIHAIYGKNAAGKMVVQTIRFSADKFSVEQAKKWLADHDYNTGIEGATGKEVTEKMQTVSGAIDLRADIFKSDTHLRIAYAVVYPVYPDGITDTQSDRMSPAEILKAAHRFMLKSRRYDLHHITLDVNPEDACVVESYIAPQDLDFNGKAITKGSWIVATKFSPKLWDRVLAGEFNAYSIRGKGIRRRTPVTATD